MKKVISAVVVVALVLSLAVVSAVGGSATTGDDVMAKIEAIIGETYPGTYSQLEAVYAQVKDEITEDEAAQLSTYVDEFETIYRAGEAAGSYTGEQGRQVMSIFDNAMAVLGYTTQWSGVDDNVDKDPEQVTVTIFKDGTAIGTIGMSSAPAGLLGDVNHSQAVDAVDATLVLQVYGGLISEDAEGFDKTLADVDANDAIDATDATYILQYYGELISKLPAA